MLIYESFFTICEAKAETKLWGPKYKFYPYFMDKRCGSIKRQKRCLEHEMLFIRQLKPTLNVQSDTIRATVFV